jgi:hypothetical protein
LEYVRVTILFSTAENPAMIEIITDLLSHQNKAKTLRNSPGGVDARFISINDTTGFKLFRDESRRDDSFDTQMRCLEIGYAPTLGEMVDLDGDYGYFTEKVETAESRFPQYSTKGRGAWEWWEDYRDDFSLDKIVHDIYEKTGWSFVDSHLCNWGIKNGEYIPIDFGD